MIGWLRRSASLLVLGICAIGAEAIDVAASVSTAARYERFVLTGEGETPPAVWMSRLEGLAWAGLGGLELSARGCLRLPSDGAEAEFLLEEARARLPLGEHLTAELGRFSRRGSPALFFPASDFVSRRRADESPLAGLPSLPADWIALTFQRGRLSLRTSYLPFRMAQVEPRPDSAWFPGAGIPDRLYDPVLAPSGFPTRLSFRDDEPKPSPADWSALGELGWVSGALSLELVAYYGWDYERSYAADLAFDGGYAWLELRQYTRKVLAFGLRASYSGERSVVYLDAAWRPRAEFAVPDFGSMFFGDPLPVARVSVLEGSLGGYLEFPRLRSRLAAEYRRREDVGLGGAEPPRPFLTSVAVLDWATEFSEGRLAAGCTVALEGLLEFYYEPRRAWAVAPRLELHPDPTWELSLGVSCAGGHAESYFGQFADRLGLSLALAMRTE